MKHLQGSVTISKIQYESAYIGTQKQRELFFAEFLKGFLPITNDFVNEKQKGFAEVELSCEAVLCDIETIIRIHKVLNTVKKQLTNAFPSPSGDTRLFLVEVHDLLKIIENNKI